MIEELKIIIAAEIAKFKRATDEAEKEVLSFKQQVEKAGKDVEDNFANMGESIKAGMSKGVDFAKKALAGLGVALVAVIKGTEEYRNNQAKLKTSFEAAGGSAETAKKTYNDLYRVLGDSGQATEAAQHLAKLTTNEKELAEWTNITKGIYATFGDSLPIESLTEAANHSAKLGEVQGTLADALEWSGISVDDFNEQLFWCNSESERQKLISETLNGIYGEAAGLYEENNAQLLAQRDAQAKLSEALAVVGEALSPVMTMLTDLAANVLTALAPHIQSFAENYLPVIKDVLGEMGGVLKDAYDWAVKHKEILAVIAGVVGTVVAAIGLYNAAMAVKEAMDAANVATVWALVSAQAANAAATLAALAPYILIVAAVAAVIAIFVLLWNKCEGFRNFWKGLWEGIKKVFTDFATSLEPIWNEIVGIFQEAWEIIKVCWSFAEPFFSGLWEAIKIICNTVMNVIVTIFKAAWENIKIVWGVVVSFFQNIGNTIKNIFGVVKNVLTGNFKGAWENIKSIFSGWGSFFTGLWNAIKKIFSNTAQAIGSAISNTVKGAVNAVLSVAAGTINGFIKAINAAISLINLIPGVDIKKLSLLNVPKLERGGVLKKGQVGLLEGNGAEAVVPLEKNTEWLDKIAERLNAKSGGNTPIILQVDGKTFAKTAVKSINELTRQQGKLSLNLV